MSGAGLSTGFYDPLPPHTLEELQSLKSAVDQALATFEDYYGESEKLASLPTMEEMVAQEEAEAKAAKAKEEEKLMFQKMMSGAMITDVWTERSLVIP